VRPRLITAVAPIRVCDCGGWTDTWFAGHGQVFNIAVEPCVGVRVAASPARGAPSQVEVLLSDTGERFTVSRTEAPWGAHPLIEATIVHMHVPEDLRISVTVSSGVPPGAATGTSAALAVALVGALDRLSGGRMSPAEVAAAAHAVEVERLAQQSGIQDQLCAAYGGVNFIEMPEYPRARVSPVVLSDSARLQLEQRLVLVYMGRSHRSTDVHRRVIERLTREGQAADVLDRLRAAAAAARAAAAGGDVAALGRAMQANTEAQAALHSSLVSDDARQLIDVARASGAVGWKVNGAGGDGGSLTLLAGASAGAPGALANAIDGAGRGWRVIPTRLSPLGVRVSESSDGPPAVPAAPEMQ
jgi:D-glycero-alpha-D-manno-heptose-7-phosphate kinase